MQDITFTPSSNKCKYLTQGASEWLSVLRDRWNIKSTIFRENEDEIVITHESGKHILMVGYLNKVSGEGYILDRREEIRK